MSARQFLIELGLAVQGLKIDLPNRKAVNVIERSYHALRARQHNPDFIKVGNIELRRTNFVMKRIHTYEVWLVDASLPRQQLGILEVFIRAKDRNCLVIMEPLK